MKFGKAYIGTSGWKYRHWEGTFYPTGLKKKDQFDYFTSKFDTVELNNSFYRQPKPENFANWRLQAPANFLYAVKANRYFTHLKKLNVEKEDIFNFLKLSDGLAEKLGPILFQLPPKWNLNIERLERFVKMLPQGHRYTFEFRNQSWYHHEVFNLLTEYNCAFCIYDLAGHQSPIIATADFVYIRLHGPGDKYQGSYDQESLKNWAKLADKWLSKGIDVYLYFDNDQAGNAAFNALEIKELIANLNLESVT